MIISKPGLYLFLILLSKLNICSAQINTGIDSFIHEKIIYTKYIKSRPKPNVRQLMVRTYIGQSDKIHSTFQNIEKTHRFDLNTMNKFPIASFYVSDGFTIPVDKELKAEEIYTPFIDSLLSNHDTADKFHLQLLIVGYCDESPSNEHDSNYHKLLLQLQQDAIEMQNYAMQISFYRAKSLGGIIAKLIEQRAQDCKIYNQVVIDLIQEGRGLEFPNSKRSYEAIDEKRRIAKIYWRMKNY